jgi:hypothetical protein
MVHQCHTKINFELGCAEIWFSDFKSGPKLTLLMLIAMAHCTISVAPQQFHITSPMGPMTDVGVSQEILMVHQCHSTINFELGCAKILFSDFKSEPKLTLLMVMAPYLLLPNSFISHLWD